MRCNIDIALQQPSGGSRVDRALRAGVCHIYQLPKGLRDLLAAPLPFGAPPKVPRENRLSPFQDFGSNPGSLGGWIHVPATVKPGAPLVVVLHGCTQTAAGYDHHAGWSALAEKNGFVVLLPEQKRANNPKLCFNWFAPRDARRGRGEALSIAQMIESVHQRHGTSRSRVFITGLSAGGAMTAAMLASYPELFAGGAIIAGLPFGTANSVPQALERMRGHQLPDQARLARLVRSASGFAGPWPTVSVWHGTLDPIVSPANAKATVDQWRRVHGLDETPSRVELVGDHTRRVWLGPDGRELVEEYEVRDLSHGTPLSTLDPGSPEVVGPHMLEAGISSTRRVARFWGIERPVRRKAARAERSDRARPPDRGSASSPAAGRSTGTRAADIETMIEKALRAAGLWR